MQRKTGIVREVYNSGSSTALLIELSDGRRVLKLATEVSPLAELSAPVEPVKVEELKTETHVDVFSEQEAITYEENFDFAESKLRIGSVVSWRYGTSTAKGRIKKIYYEPIELTVQGVKIKRNGSVDNPALLIEQANGVRVLKLWSEVLQAEFTEESITYPKTSYSTINDFEEAINSLSLEFAAAPKTKKKCLKGTACGNTCISPGKTCKKSLSPEAKQKVKEVKEKLGKSTKEEKPLPQKPAPENTTETSKIGSREEFENEIFDEYLKSQKGKDFDNRHGVSIERLRKRLGDRISDAQFDEFMFDMQGDDLVLMKTVDGVKGYQVKGTFGNNTHVKAEISQDDIKTRINDNKKKLKSGKASKTDLLEFDALIASGKQVASQYEEEAKALAEISAVRREAYEAYRKAPFKTAADRKIQAKAKKEFEKLQEEEKKVAAVFVAKVQKFRDDLINNSPLDADFAKNLATKMGIEDTVVANHGNATQLRERVADFHRLTNGATQNSIGELRVTNDRAYASSTGKYINMGAKRSADDTDRVLWHEAAHHIEFQDPAIGKAMKAWIRSRSTGEEAKLSELTGSKNYKNDEVALKGNFIHPYVGKIYGKDVTEVVSMGLENFRNAESMAKFAKQDPEHFALMIGIITRLQGKQ